MRYILFIIIIFSATISFAQKDSFVVYFSLNESELAPAAQQTIDSLIYYDHIFPSQTLAIVGYTDYLASDEYNMKLSQQRAENVKSYLVKSGFSADNITLCIGKGKIQNNSGNGRAGNNADRKVMIAVTKKPKVLTNKPKNIEQLKVNETVTLNNISFWGGSANVLKSSIPELEKLYDVMKNSPKLRIRIEGHICCDPQNLNFSLSTERAKVIYDYLVNKGIDSHRLEYKGCGTANPVVIHEVTEADCAKNRRVEIRILGK